MIEIKIPDEYVQLCKNWHDGSASMMYAVASTGNLTRGSIRPSTTDNRPYTDEEWEWSLWSKLAREVREACKVSTNQGMERFARYVEAIEGQLVVEYGIDL